MKTLVDGPALSVDSILTTLPERYHPLYQVRAGLCQFHIEGPGGGDYHTACDGDSLQVSRGIAPRPGCTVTMPADDFVRWCLGQIRDQDLLASGRLSVAGDAELLSSMVMILITGVPREIHEAVRHYDEQARRRPPITRIDRVSQLSPALLREASRTKTPFVLTGATDGWPAASWSLESLRARFGRIPFPVRKISASSPWVALAPLASDRPGAAAGMRLADFIDDMVDSSPDDEHPPHTDLMTLPDELLAELGALPVFPAAAATRVRPELFLSAAGAYTGVHRDLEDGASCVFVGRRRFRLWSPDQAATLYAMPNLHPKFQACFVDARRPDLDRFPRFADAVALEVTLEHGEALYLPFGWFHDVFVLEHGMTVRFDYPHDLHRLVA